tara:strand:- start:1413 stop:1658 length:246 start_codon:yes stop_codon:yes gene_type:complete
MCIICVEYQEGKLTANEAWKNLNEMQILLDVEHIDDILNMIFFGDEYENTAKPTNIDYNQPSTVDPDTDYQYWNYDPKEKC